MAQRLDLLIRDAIMSAEKTLELADDADTFCHDLAVDSHLGESRHKRCTEYYLL